MKRKRNTFWSCRRKRRYNNPQDAWNAALRTPSKPGCQTQPYECEFCKGWHVANKPLTPTGKNVITASKE